MTERRRKRPPELGESQSPFAPGAVTADQIFESWDHRCAFTGVELRREAAADPFGTLLRFSVPEDPTQLPPGSAIPASLDAIWAFEQGHLTIGLRDEFLVALDVISPEFLETLNASGRLAPPRLALLRPDPVALARHRADFIANRFDVLG